MKRTRTPARLVAAALTISIAVAACGDDDEDTTTGATAAPAASSVDTDAAATTAPSTAAPAADTTAAATDTTATAGDTAAPSGAAADVPPIPGGTAADEFCEGFVGVELAIKNAPEEPEAFEAFAAEQLVPNIERAEANLPEGDLGSNVQVMLDAVGQVMETGDFGAFETPEFGEASAAVYSGLEDACGIPDVEVTAVDYAYEGVPATMDAGLTTFVMANESQSGEFHEMALVKIKDGVDTPLDELLAMPEDEVMANIETFGGGAFAPVGVTSGTVVNLTPGRWVYACFIPVGTVGDTEGSGPPHFVEGMAGELTVG